MSDARRAPGGRVPVIFVLFLAGPVIWFLHFMAVYLLVEAGCAAGGLDVRLLGLRALSFLTLVATALAVVATLLLARRAHHRWRAPADGSDDWLAGSDRNSGLALAGFLLALLFVVAVLFVGVPAAFLDPC